MFETPEDEVEAVKAMVLQEMPSALELSVPLTVDVKIGRTWADLE